MVAPHLFQRVHALIEGAVAELQATGAIPPDLDLAKLSVDPPRDPAHGDLASNVGMVLAKQSGRKPRDIAEWVGRALERDDAAGVESVSIDGPGFLNLRPEPRIWRAELAQVLRAGPSFGDSRIGEGRPVNVEYVSANPTGPLHIGHARGAVFGDALANLLEKAGFAVTREYYINDAGAQVDALARSAHLRYLEQLGRDVGAIPEGLYPGEYLKPVGSDLAASIGATWADAPEAEWLAAVRRFAIAAMMDLIRADLAALGIRHEVFSSERALVEAGGVERAVAELDRRGLIYVGVLEPPKGKLPEDWEPRPQTLFRATRFGDDVDRPLKKSDGGWTYFAADIAYHWDKVRRGSPSLIDVLGADHGGYIKRMVAAVAALTDGAGALDVKVCQIVNLLEAGEPVKMSKRSGSFVSLAEVIERVGKDVVRFIMLTRRNDATLDFDLARVVEQSKDNPVFYVQYAHARAASVLRHAAEALPGQDLSPAALAAVDLAPLTDPAEFAVIRQLAAFPRLIEAAADAHEPHRVAFYLGDLAASFHALWNKGKDDAALRFILAEDRPATLARLALVSGVKIGLAAALATLGVEPAEEL